MQSLTTIQMTSLAFYTTIVLLLSFLQGLATLLNLIVLYGHFAVLKTLLLNFEFESGYIGGRS